MFLMTLSYISGSRLTSESEEVEPQDSPLDDTSADTQGIKHIFHYTFILQLYLTP